jgi:HD superfamily phosphohydrolase
MFEYAERLARWADALRSDTEWTSELESSFDAIGFDESYLSTLKEARRKYNRIKAIKDHIWGMIEIEPSDAWLLDSPLFQRMRHIRQTGLTYLTYPNAHHTRFEHSLGVYFVVKRLLATFRRTKEAFNIAAQHRTYLDIRFTPVAYERHSRQERLLLHAALLHDIGHAVFSHVSERLFAANSDRLRIGKKSIQQFRRSFQEKYDLVDSDIQTGRGKPLAELLTVGIITSSRFARFYRLLPGQPDTDPLPDLCDISTLVLGDRIEPNDFALPELLSGPVDADKIDYMIRDAHKPEHVN